MEPATLFPEGCKRKVKEMESSNKRIKSHHHYPPIPSYSPGVGHPDTRISTYLPDNSPLFPALFPVKQIPHRHHHPQIYTICEEMEVHGHHETPQKLPISKPFKEDFSRNQVIPTILVVAYLVEVIAQIFIIIQCCRSIIVNKNLWDLSLNPALVVVSSLLSSFLVTFLSIFWVRRGMDFSGRVCGRFLCYVMHSLLLGLLWRYLKLAFAFDKADLEEFFKLKRIHSYVQSFPLVTIHLAWIVATQRTNLPYQSLGSFLVVLELISVVISMLILPPAKSHNLQDNKEEDGFDKCSKRTSECGRGLVISARLILLGVCLEKITYSGVYFLVLRFITVFAWIAFWNRRSKVGKDTGQSDSESSNDSGLVQNPQESPFSKRVNCIGFQNCLTIGISRKRNENSLKLFREVLPSSYVLFWDIKCAKTWGNALPLLLVFVENSIILFYFWGEKFLTVGAICLVFGWILTLISVLGKATENEEVGVESEVDSGYERKDSFAEVNEKLCCSSHPLKIKRKEENKESREIKEPEVNKVNSSVKKKKLPEGDLKEASIKRIPCRSLNSTPVRHVKQALKRTISETSPHHLQTYQLHHELPSQSWLGERNEMISPQNNLTAISIEKQDLCKELKESGFGSGSSSNSRADPSPLSDSSGVSKMKEKERFSVVFFEERKGKRAVAAGLYQDEIELNPANELRSNEITGKTYLSDGASECLEGLCQIRASTPVEIKKARVKHNRVLVNQPPPHCQVGTKTVSRCDCERGNGGKVNISCEQLMEDPYGILICENKIQRDLATLRIICKKCLQNHDPLLTSCQIEESFDIVQSDSTDYPSDTELTVYNGQEYDDVQSLSTHLSSTYTWHRHPNHYNPQSHQQKPQPTQLSQFIWAASSMIPASAPKQFTSLEYVRTWLLAHPKVFQQQPERIFEKRQRPVGRGASPPPQEINFYANTAKENTPPLRKQHPLLVYDGNSSKITRPRKPQNKPRIRKEDEFSNKKCRDQLDLFHKELETVV